MQGLIKSAFRHMSLDGLGHAVERGRYDLVRSTGEVILPKDWRRIIEPGWSISMSMWSAPTSDSDSDSDSDSEAARLVLPRKPKQHLLDNQGRSLRLDRYSVFHLPGDTDTDPATHKERYLTLVLFDIFFNQQADGAEIFLTCKLSLLGIDGLRSAQGNTALEIAKTAFFQPSPSGAFQEPIEGELKDTRTGIADVGTEMEASTVFRVQGVRHNCIFAVLFWRPRREFPVTLPVTFQARDADSGSAWLRNPPGENAFVSPLPNAPPQRWTPFSWASRFGWQDALRLLLQQPQVRQNRRDMLGRSAFSWAAGTGQEDATRLFMAQPETNPDERDDEERTPLSWAAGEGHVKTMQLLLRSDKRAEPTLQDSHGRTPLSWAAGNGHAEAVQLLIRHVKMADPSLGEMTDHGEMLKNSPISWAARNGHDNVLQILLDEQRGRVFASSCLHKAAEQGWATVTKLLIQKGASVDPPDPDHNDYTPLCVAAESGRVEVVQLLLQAGANPNHQTRNAQDTPLILAVQHGHEAVVKALLMAGADPLANAKGYTPKVLAGGLGHAAIFNMIDAMDEEGRLAITAEEPYLDPSIDCKFQATVVHLFPKFDILQSTRAEVDVGSLLKEPTSFTSPAGRQAIRWFHLPANNVSPRGSLVRNALYRLTYSGRCDGSRQAVS